jgi:hypothetical protein
MGKAKKTIGTEKPVYKRERVAMTDADRVNNQPYDIDVIKVTAPQTKRSKITNLLAAAALVVVALSLGVLFMLASANENILTVNNSPLPVRTIREHPTENGVVILNVDLCKNSDVVGQIRTSFVSKSSEIFTPLADEELHEGCLVREVPVLIPDGIPAGAYKIKFRVTYDLNPLKKDIVSEFESKEFVVDPVTR